MPQLTSPMTWYRPLIGRTRGLPLSPCDKEIQNGWLTASSYMGKYLRISSYIRKPFHIHVWLCNCSTLNFLLAKQRYCATISHRRSELYTFSQLFKRMYSVLVILPRLYCILVEKELLSMANPPFNLSFSIHLAMAMTSSFYIFCFWLCWLLLCLCMSPILYFWECLDS